MTHDISIDDLYCLVTEIESYISACNAAERAYCEGCSEYEELRLESLSKAVAMKAQLRSVAIQIGIHGEFLDEYMDSCKRNGLKLTVAA